MHQELLRWSETCHLVLERVYVISVAAAAIMNTVINQKISRRSHDEPFIDAVLARGRGVLRALWPPTMRFRIWGLRVE